MNILILNWRDPKHPLAGGAEIYLLNHAKFWMKKGAKVEWFASSFKNAKKEENIQGINVIRKGNTYNVFLHFILQWRKGSFRKSDVIIDCFHFIPFFTPIFIRKRKIIALIHEVAGGIWFHNIILPIALIGFIFEPLIIFMYRGKNFVTVSNSTKKELVKYGIPKKRIVVIENGFNKPTTLKIMKAKKSILIYVGRISKDKGIEDAIKAVNVLYKKIPDLELWILGKDEDPRYSKKIKHYINRLKIHGACKFFGFVSEKEKFLLLSRAKILLHPSKKEGWGLNVIEAGYVKTPTVGYNVPGLRDSIEHKKTGLLVKPDPVSLAKGVETLIKDQKLWKKLSENCKKRSLKFSWEKSGKESYNLIQNINDING